MKKSSFCKNLGVDNYEGLKLVITYSLMQKNFKRCDGSRFKLIQLELLIKP